ncbi:MAG TPA: hypothetical protein VL551_15005 [Actinospica sp.]|nr:hypothetical protein [Actinospica sp.]
MVTVLAVGCTALWIALAVRIRTRRTRATRSIEVPQPLSPVPAQDGPVPVPIRLALRHKSQLNDPAMLNATVMELADAGLFHIEPADSQRPVMVSPNVLPHASKLPAYQASVVARLLHRRGVGQQPVPLTALQPGEDDRANTWYKEFVKQVRQAATERGLLQPPANGAHVVGLLVLGIPASELIATAVADATHTSGLRIAVFVPLCVLGFAVSALVCRVRPTPAGRALLAELQQQAPAPIPAQPQAPTQESVPAAAPGPAPVKVLPEQFRPLPANQVWSDYGGSWHPLNVDSKETYSINSGIPGSAVLIVFALISIVGVLFAKHDGDPSGGLPFTVFGVLPIILLAGAAASLLRRRNLPKRAVLRGRIAKLWTVTHRGDESSTTYYYCALDVGRAPESVRLKIHRTLYGRLQVGAEIEVLVNPRRRSIKDFRFAEPG